MSENDSTQNAASETASQSQTPLTEREQRAAVRKRYGDIGEIDSDARSCCDDEGVTTQSERLGYAPEETASVAPGADLGLGCGNHEGQKNSDC